MRKVSVLWEGGGPSANLPDPMLSASWWGFAKSAAFVLTEANWTSDGTCARVPASFCPASDMASKGQLYSPSNPPGGTLMAILLRGQHSLLWPHTPSSSLPSTELLEDEDQSSCLPNQLFCWACPHHFHTVASKEKINSCF